MRRMGLLGAGLAAVALMAAAQDTFEEIASTPRRGSARNKPSGSKPVAGGGAKERARRAARMAIPEIEVGPCNMTETEIQDAIHMTETGTDPATAVMLAKQHP